MKKRMILLTAAISASLVLMTGCSKEADGAVSSRVESSSEVESSLETETSKEQAAQETESTEAAEETKEESDGTESEGILKIWGTIQMCQRERSRLTISQEYLRKGSLFFILTRRRRM